MAIAWTNVPATPQKTVVAVFLGAAIGLSSMALLALRSQGAFLKGFYGRRREVEKLQDGLKLRSESTGAGNTLNALKRGFRVAILLFASLLVLLQRANKKPVFQGAKLLGADLTAVQGLAQRDFEGVCGNSTTKLPQGLTIAARK